MNIFKNQMEHLTADDRQLLEEYFRGYDYRGAAFTFPANYIWRNTHCLCWEVIGDYLCMAGADCMISSTPTAIMSMPMTRNGKYEPEKLRETILEARARFAARKIPFSVELIPGHMVPILEEAFPGEMEFTHDRDADEYVYLKEKMITLSGRALHKKKNHFNYFKKTYSYETVKISKDMIDKVMDFVVQCKIGKTFDEDEMESLNMEEEAIRNMLEFVDSPDVTAIAVLIDGNLEAFAIGECLDDYTAVEHFEKANDAYRGLYQVICSEFCKALPESIEYVNREEDMGLANLRHAKEALKPHHMEEKYSGCFLQNSIV